MVKLKVNYLHLGKTSALDGKEKSSIKSYKTGKARKS